MDANSLPENNPSEIWRALLEKAALTREEPIVAETFLRRWNSYSRPIALGCDNGKEYVVKGQHAGRGIVNDQVIARLGISLGAPVGEPAIVYIPSELKAIEPELHDITEGTAHATMLVKECSDRSWLKHIDKVENRSRFALLAVLYGWCHAGDHQLIYENHDPHRVHSVDHGHFFPGGPNWTIASLATVNAVSLSNEIVQGCNLTADEQKTALASLQLVDNEAIVRAVAMPPDEWGMTIDERISLVNFLIQRRDELLITI